MVIVWISYFKTMRCDVFADCDLRKSLWIFMYLANHPQPKNHPVNT